MPDPWAATTRVSGPLRHLSFRFWDNLDQKQCMQCGGVANLGSSQVWSSPRQGDQTTQRKKTFEAILLHLGLMVPTSLDAKGSVCDEERILSKDFGRNCKGIFGDANLQPTGLQILPLVPSKFPNNLSINGLHPSAPALETRVDSVSTKALRDPAAMFRVTLPSQA